MKRLLLIGCVVAQLFFVGCFGSNDDIYPDPSDARVKSVSSTATYLYAGGSSQEDIELSFDYDADGNVSTIESRFYVENVDNAGEKETIVATIDIVLSYDEAGVVYVETVVYDSGVEDYIMDEKWMFSSDGIVWRKAITNINDTSRELTYNYSSSNIQSVVEKVISGNVESNSYTYSYSWSRSNIVSYHEPRSITTYSYDSFLPNNVNIDINALLTLLIGGFDYYDYKMLPGLLKMMGVESRNIVSSINDGRDTYSVSWLTAPNGLVIGADVAVDSSTEITCKISYE